MLVSLGGFKVEILHLLTGSDSGLDLGHCRRPITELTAGVRRSYLLLSLQPAVHHGMIGTERRAGRLSLKLPLIGPRPCVPWQTAIRVQAFTLHRCRNTSALLQLNTV